MSPHVTTCHDMSFELRASAAVPLEAVALRANQTDLDTAAVTAHRHPGTALRFTVRRPLWHCPIKAPMAPMAPCGAGKAILRARGRSKEIWEIWEMIAEYCRMGINGIIVPCWKTRDSNSEATTFWFRGHAVKLHGWWQWKQGGSCEQSTLTHDPCPMAAVWPPLTLDSSLEKSSWLETETVHDSKVPDMFTVCLLFQAVPLVYSTAADSWLSQQSSDDIAWRRQRWQVHVTCE